MQKVESLVELDPHFIPAVLTEETRTQPKYLRVSTLLIGTLYTLINTIQ